MIHLIQMLEIQQQDLFGMRIQELMHGLENILGLRTVQSVDYVQESVFGPLCNAQVEVSDSGLELLFAVERLGAAPVVDDPFRETAGGSNEEGVVEFWVVGGNV